MRSANLLKEAAEGFYEGWKHAGHAHHATKHCVANDVEVRKNLNEDQIDKMVEDSMLASDPVSMY